MARAPFIAGLFSRWRNSSSISRTDLAAPHLILGRQGERLAARHLRRQGYKVLSRNYRPSHGGEIDLVCRDGKTLVFVEVKTRAPSTPGRPADAVDQEKEAALLRGATSWLRLLGNPPIPVRIDLVEIILTIPHPAITLTRDALACPTATS